MRRQQRIAGDQSYFGWLGEESGKPVPSGERQLNPAGAAANDDDPVQTGGSG